MNKAVVINADDLGLTLSVNKGIFEAMDAGVVSDASLLASGEGFEDAVRGLKDRGRGAVGLHFCLVDKERPLSSTLNLSPLLEDGHFPLSRNKLFFNVLFRSSEMIRLIAAELEAQIRKILDSGLRISHIDSHQHTHLFPGISGVVVAACRKYEIPFLRTPATRLTSPVAFAVEGLSFRLRNALKGTRVHGVPSLGFEMSGHASKVGLLENMARAKRYPVAEIMVHPGREDDRTNEKYRHWGYHWNRELDTLLELKKEFLDHNMMPVSFEGMRDMGNP